MSDYSGKSSTVSEHGFTKTTTLNNEGFVDKITDAAGDIKYSLRPDGQPKSITAPDGSVTSFEYDDYGRQTSITDPSAGLVSYGYDKNGYVNKQTDAEGRISETVYNKYGLPTGATVKKGSTTELSTSYGYNSDNLLQTVSAGGTTISYTYDGLLCTKTRTETVSGVSITGTYDYTAGKLTKVTYSGLSGTQPPATEYVYTNDYLRSIKSGSTTVKTVNAKNNFGQTIQYILGNGVLVSRVMDPNGLLTALTAKKGATAIQDFSYSIDPLKGVLNSRKDNTRNITETFTYDNLQRLTNYTRNGQTEASVVYSDMGNITSKTDAGTLDYNVSGKPYAIGAQTGNPGSIPARLQNIAYTSFQRPSTIEENGYKATITYGPDRERSKMEMHNNSILQYTRYYLGGCYEKDVPASGSTTERLYIGGNAYNAPAVYIRTGSGAWTLHYIHRDHIGSITAITNSSGSKVAEYSYDPWGRQRNPVNQQTYAPDAAPVLLLGRGYTGHEHLPMFGLINMNARLYDPVLGRFLSPDPYVQAPDFSQSYNRYSYCLNNPLMYVDEDGELWWLIPVIAAAVFATGNTVAHAIRGDINNVGDFFKYFGQGAVTGFALGCAWQFAPLIPYIGTGVQTAMTWYTYVQLGGAALSTVSGLGQGISTGDWNALANAGKMFAGNFYLDENRPFFDGVWQGFSRHTWEFIQTGLGHTIGQVRNTFGGVDNVDYFGGATLINNNDNSTTRMWGFTLGPFINSKNLDVNDEMFRHEYGHTLQSKRWGLLYPFVVGIPSALSSNFSTSEQHRNRWYEKDANRYGERYYRKYFRNSLTLNPWDDTRYPRH